MPTNATISSRPICCAVIPARGGSKGIPKKNLHPLAGRPLVVHSVAAALAANSIDSVYVSTDSADIARVAKAAGAEVIHRPAEIANNSASSEAALLHALKALDANGYVPDLLAFLQCTSPLTAPEDIDGTVAALVREQADSAFAVTRFDQFLWSHDAHGTVVGVNHDKEVRLRRQDRAPEYLETGAVYVMGVSGFRKARHRFFGKTVFYEMPAERVLEIDRPIDLELAEARLIAFARRRVPAQVPRPVDAVVMDFDGVFTDNRVLTLQDGNEGVFCSRADGMGVEALRKSGVRMLILSKERNPVVAARAAKMNLPCLQGIDDKASALSRWADEHGVRLSNTVYVGNDINDVACLALVGFGVAVADAHPKALVAAKFVLSRPGGSGAIRELAELIRNHREPVSE